MRIFGEKLKIYHITEVPQEYIQPRLILNLYEKNDGGTPIVNYTTYREVEPELMKFGQALPRILWEIWESDPTKGPVRVSKLNAMDAYHCVTLRTSQVGTFTYVVPLSPGDDGVIICINLVLTMG